MVILTLGAIESASFNSNFDTSVEMDPILTNFDDFISNQVGKIVILTNPPQLKLNTTNNRQID